MKSAMIYRLIALAILVCFGVHHYLLTRKPVEFDRYHENVRLAADEIPRHIGGWVGEDIPVPTRANALLRPNVIISRRYTNVENGMSVGLLLVHCSDAHSMAGHFPLRCYPAEGWILQTSSPHDWQVEDLQITGTEYIFSINEPGRTRSITVANCMLLPNGRILRDMNSMARSIGGVGGDASGAGQLQIIFEAGVDPDRQDKAIQELVAGYKDVIHSILADPLK